MNGTAARGITAVNAEGTDDIIIQESPASGIAQPIAADFLTVATKAIRHGVKVTPLRSCCEQAVLRKWNRPAGNLSEIVQWSRDFPNHNVGIVSNRGVCNHIFLDIDAAGLAQQIEQETGTKLPLTYTVASRARSAPYKHLIFKQTAYSASHLKKETKVEPMVFGDSKPEEEVQLDYQAGNKQFRMSHCES